MGTGGVGDSCLDSLLRHFTNLTHIKQVTDPAQLSSPCTPVTIVEQQRATSIMNAFDVGPGTDSEKTAIKTGRYTIEYE